MKSIILLRKLAFLFLQLLLVTTNLFGQKDFSNLSNASDSSYGYSAEKPLRLKNGNVEKSVANSYHFISGLKTQDDQDLKVLSRSTVADPNYKKPAIQINNRFTGMPLNGKAGMLDKYVFLTSNTKDTITLFVDLYNKGTLMLPAGLKYVQRNK